MYMRKRAPERKRGEQRGFRYRLTETLEATAR